MNSVAQDRPGRRRTAVLFVLVLLVLGLLASEGVVRLLLPHNSPETIRAYSLDYESAPFTRSRLTRMSRLVEVDGEKAWGAKSADEKSEHTFYINGQGFRGPPFSPRKPSGTTRVFVIGGSAVFDQEVSDEEASIGNSWPNRAQELLRERGLDVEVINAGTPGHSSTDALGRLISEIWVYEPDFVILYSGWNDLKNFRGVPITPDQPLSWLIRPFNATADPYRNYVGPWDRLLSKSQLYVKFRNLYLRNTLPAGGEGILPSGQVASTYGPWGPRQYEQNLRNFVEVVQIMGGRPVLSTQATLVLNPDAGADTSIGYEYQLLDRPGLVRAFEDVYRITRTVAGESDTPLLDAGTALNGEAKNFSDHVHLSPAGSEALARLLAEFLTPLLQGSSGPGG